MTLEEHLLTILNEECLEIGKDVCKALRFGLDDRNILDPTGPTNKERIVAELNDLMAMIEMLCYNRILPRDWENKNSQQQKISKVLQFLEYSDKKGKLV